MFRHMPPTIAGVADSRVEVYPGRIDEGADVQKVSLIALARTELELALRASSGRKAKTVFGGHERRLRQTLIALRAGEGLSEHESPGEATLYVVRGRVLLRSGDSSWNGSPGDLLTIPDAVHAVDAVEDSVVLLTVVKLP
jgi:quercetin dioxygenase-like cupin family protein